jgi:chemotaxis protein MotA
MLVFIGLMIVILSVFGGFHLSGGHLLALFQPYELMMIGGAALGSFVVSNDMRSIKMTLRAIKSILKGSKYKREFNVQLLSVFFELLTKIRKDGVLAIEGDIQNPKESPLFSNYPLVQADPKVMEFIVDHMQLIITGRVDAHHLDEMIDIDIETYEHEIEIPISAISKVADSLPAFGIVAAVMGVVHTMESMNQPPAVLGGLVAAALVGTFLGVLLGYGFIAPLAVAVEMRRNATIKILQATKVLLMSAATNAAPSIGVELARKVLYSDVRPNSAELEEILKEIKSGGGANSA